MFRRACTWAGLGELTARFYAGVVRVRERAGGCWGGQRYRLGSTPLGKQRQVGALLKEARLYGNSRYAQTRWRCSAGHLHNPARQEIGQFIFYAFALLLPALMPCFRRCWRRLLCCAETCFSNAVSKPATRRIHTHTHRHSILEPHTLRSTASRAAVPPDGLLMVQCRRANFSEGELAMRASAWLAEHSSRSSSQVASGARE
ncbi:uncharacterized protein K460DRAFT_430535 [Cucurbitaria berberidis CBS 394.84]|uniref:Uncharacterized protein n=1 Tax=Cucurbitaria berberidis CBS 394.84 TaxID=1168544 RepID=A0A9P4L8X2_9PLEO|nr:uncharacterized protein K460DRAFT_430535 [Cucurbitaria berberidis CBS 394.84]KAF1845629.1 hypothetical protein K460DRAFT_430535 [Cucurbitaria berberidis CBS 394.84]